MLDARVETLYRSDAETEEPIALRQIRWISSPFEIGFALLAGLATVLFLTILVLAYVPRRYVTFTADGGWLTIDPSTAPVDGVTVSSLPIVLQAAGLVLAGVIYASLLLALWSLKRLFACYRQGIVFADAPIRHMNRAGAGLVIYALAPGLAQPVMRALGSPDRAWFHGETIPILLTGGGLFVFARIMALGVRIAQDNKGFV